MSLPFVVTDWNMREMNGRELLQAFRADAVLNNLPVLMMTADSSKHEVVAAKQAGKTISSSSHSPRTPSAPSWK